MGRQSHWFSLTEDNVVFAAGELWRRLGAIPMGGALSAQSADLHSVLCCKQMVTLLHSLGELEHTDDRIEPWVRHCRAVVLQSFRDDLVVAAKGLQRIAP